MISTPFNAVKLYIIKTRKIYPPESGPKLKT